MPKLSVADKVIVPVKFSMKDGKKIKPFAYTLTCDRLTADEFQRRIKGDGDFATNGQIKQVMKEITTDWQGQTLVIEDDDEPSAFGEEALQLMFDTAGVLDVVVASYMKESAAQAKN